jgi:ATP-binding cassette subfamily C (CFTR/MRP) protein 4
VTLQVPAGTVVAVVGSTASGKTSLLQAILGEMPVPLDETNGAMPNVVRREFPIAFAPQHPCIFNASVKQSILFGFSERRYAECLRCCDLEKDLALLKWGDETKVGENGIALSGGQKARVGLARAAYRQHHSDIFMFDDPIQCSWFARCAKSAPVDD